MKRSRSSMAAILAVIVMSVCTGVSRADSYDWAFTGVRSGSEAVNINYKAGNQNGGYYTDYTTTLATSQNGANSVRFNTFCVDLLHETPSGFTQLATPAVPSTSSYSGASATNPGTVSDQSVGWAAWLVNTYSSSATTVDQQAGLQIAIWKILYETDRSDTGLTTLGAGAIQFTQYGNYSGAITAAIVYLKDFVAERTALGGVTPSSSAYLVNYKSDGSGNHDQYQLIATVPEPSTLAIACLGAFGFTGYALRRRCRRA